MYFGEWSTQAKVDWLVKEWDRIPSALKVDIRDGRSATVSGLPDEDHTVVLLLDRQKPSVEPDYDFDEERIGFTRSGKILWGFDSGCSCPTPWGESFPKCYQHSSTYKEFEVNLQDFDAGAEQAIDRALNKLIGDLWNE